MRHAIGSLRAAGWLVLVTLPGASIVQGNEVNLVHTNWVQRWITNMIEVQAPANRFVNQFHTNWVNKFWTNVVDVYSTNNVTRFQTNRVVVDAFRTNFVQAYQTNLKTLHITNWTTVLVLHTNWVTQQITNVVDLDLPAKRAEKAGPRASNEQMNPTSTLAQMDPAPAGRSEPLAIAASKVPRLLPNNQIEVKLMVHWTNDTTAPVQVQQWRVEREDGTILCFGQDQEFKRGLPVGKYKVKVRAQREANGPLLAALGTLAVTPGEVVLQQRATVRN